MIKLRPRPLSSPIGEPAMELVEAAVIHGVKIPAGFCYNGASIPAAAWQVVGTPFHPAFLTPALVHDWLYLSHQASREQADWFLAHLLKRNQVPRWKIALINRAVRMFGGGYWENTEEDARYLASLLDP